MPGYLLFCDLRLDCSSCTAFTGGSDCFSGSADAAGCVGVGAALQLLGASVKHLSVTQQLLMV